ncbi:MAG: hypothetical protein WC974_08485 [Thermoplasmata archaeon]
MQSEKRFNHTITFNQTEYDLLHLLAAKKKTSQGKLVGELLREKAKKLKISVAEK